MIQELVYTSAPQGLRPGAKGYCTVAATPGMAKTLVDQLESLSGYRHHFQPQDRLAHLNPVNFSHLRITVGGIRYQVLTRAADAGVDYTQRSNKIAHHLVLDAQEMAAAKCGPAAILAAPGVMRTTWNEAPRQLEMPARSWPADRPPAVCQTWIDVTRDAGWAGALCETFLARPVQTACVLFEPGMPLLALVAEAMSLLTPQERWELGFSTYFTRLPPGIDCHWRFVINGTPEAKTIPRLPNTKLFNLCAPMARANGGELVETARSGIVTRSGPNRAFSAGNMATLAPQQRQEMIAPVDQPAMQDVPQEIELLPVGPPQRAGSSSRLPAMAASSQRLRSVGNKRGSKWMKPVSIVFGLVAFAAVCIGGTYWFATRNQQQLAQAPKEENSTATAEKKPTGRPPKNDHQRKKDDNRQAAKPKEDNPEPPKPGTTDDGPASQPLVTPTPLEASPAPVTTPTPPNGAVASTVGLSIPGTPSPSGPPKEKPKPTRDPFENLAARRYMLDLPPTSTGVVGAPAPSQELAELYVDDPKDCELEIVGAKDVFGYQTNVFIEPPPAAQKGASREWRVQRALIDPSGLSPKLKPVLLATVLLDKFALIFRWDSEMAKGDTATQLKADMLKACLLKIRVGDREEICTLMQSPLGVAMPIQFVESDKKDPLKLLRPENTYKGPPPGVRAVTVPNDQPRFTVPLLDQNAPALPFKTLPANLQITLLPPRSADPNLKLSVKSSPTNSQIAVDVDGQGHGFYIDLEVRQHAAGTNENPSPDLNVSVKFDQISVVSGKDNDDLKWEQKDLIGKNFILTSERVQKRIDNKKPIIAEIEKKYNFEFDQLAGRAKVAADNKNPDEAQRLRQEANQLRETQKNDPKLNKANQQLREAVDMQNYLKHLQHAIPQFQQSVVIGFRLSLAHKEREIVLIQADPNSVKIDPAPVKSDSKPEDKRDKNPK